MEFHAGRPHGLTDDIKQKILTSIRKDIIVSNSAKMARVMPDTVYDWIKRGKNDLKLGTKSEFAQFALEIGEAQALRISEILAILVTRPTNWQALTWILERCAREDFGADAGVIQELLAKFAEITQALKRKENTIENIKELPVNG